MIRNLNNEQAISGTNSLNNSSKLTNKISSLEQFPMLNEMVTKVLNGCKINPQEIDKSRGLE
jgi:hypothetical protein